jgi:hypothetical protein
MTMSYNVLKNIHPDQRAALGDDQFVAHHWSLNTGDELVVFGRSDVSSNEAWELRLSMNMEATSVQIDPLHTWPQTLPAASYVYPVEVLRVLNRADGLAPLVRVRVTGAERPGARLP